MYFNFTLEVNNCKDILIRYKIYFKKFETYKSLKILLENKILLLFCLEFFKRVYAF